MKKTVAFLDNQEFDIKEEASLVAIVAVVPDFTALGTLADALTKPGNLDIVNFKTDGKIDGEYADMKVETPLFKAVDLYTDEKKVLATFAIRKKTEMELAIEELRASQEVQDGAIGDLGDVVSGLAEGGVQ